jgi:cathepsin A (carboxypeptidase C)
MWVDQPAGVGFSYGVMNDQNETMVGEDMYHFLQSFFTKHPEYAASEFYVFGESYGGHYAPAIASRIFEGNNKKEGLIINLKGVGVGNGLTDPVIQYQYYPAMAMNNSYDIKTVTEDQYKKMNERMPACVKLAKACQFNHSICEQADTFCNLEETTPYYNSGLNPYDIRVPCGESDLCYDFDNIETYLNLPEVRTALHVSDKSAKWQACNTLVNVAFIKDWMRNYQ